MSNTFNAALVMDQIAKTTLTVLGNRLAPLSSFTRDFSTDVLVQGQNVLVPFATAGGSTQTNPTNWESGDSTISNINVPIATYSQSFHLTPLQLNNGFRLEQIVQVNAEAFANKLCDVAFTPLTTTNFQNITVAQASLVSANLKTIWAAIAKSPVRNIILDATAYSQLLPTDKNSFVPGQGAYGFDGFFLNTRWTGAGTNIYGFAGGPNAVGIAAGIPQMTATVAANMIEQRTVTIDQLGLTAQLNMWASVATRTTWASMDIMFGAAKGDNTAGIVLKSA